MNIVVVDEAPVIDSLSTTNKLPIADGSKTPKCVSLQTIARFLNANSLEVYSLTRTPSEFDQVWDPNQRFILTYNQGKWYDPVGRQSFIGCLYFDRLKIFSEHWTGTGTYTLTAPPEAGTPPTVDTAYVNTLAGSDANTCSLYKRVYVPVGATTLSALMGGWADPAHPNSGLRVFEDSTGSPGTLIGKLARAAGADAWGATPVTLNIAAYAGQWIHLNIWDNTTSTFGWFTICAIKIT